MIVVDANVIAYLFFDSPYLKEVEALFQKDGEWAAPLLWRSEFRSVLGAYLRQGKITTDKALEIFDRALELVAGREFEVRSENVLTLISKSTCSSYDLEYVSLALEMNVPLLTFDKKVLGEFPLGAIEPK